MGKTGYRKELAQAARSSGAVTRRKPKIAGLPTTEVVESREERRTDRGASIRVWYFRLACGHEVWRPRRNFKSVPRRVPCRRCGQIPSDREMGTQDGIPGKMPERLREAVERAAGEIRRDR